MLNILDGTKFKSPPLSNCCGEKGTNPQGENEWAPRRDSLVASSTGRPRKAKDSSGSKSRLCGKLFLMNQRDTGRSKDSASLIDLKRIQGVSCGRY